MRHINPLFFACLAAATLSGCANNPSRQSSAQQSLSGAVYTTTDPAVDGAGTCLNGNPAVNCNIYTGKSYVWLDGGPGSSALPDGTYFFAVLAPGGQHNPNDGAPDLLSSDAESNRVFTITGGVTTYSGTHVFDPSEDKINLMPYANTPNPGGVYIMAICQYAGGAAVDPSTCKYDMFKINNTGGGGGGSGNPPPSQNADLVVSKSAAGSLTRTYSWSVAKSVSGPTELEGGFGTDATVTYAVAVTEGASTDSAWAVSGTIEIDNINTTDFAGVTVKDVLGDGTTCSIDPSWNGLVPAETSVFVSYSCSPSSSSATSNTVSAAWNATTYNTPDAGASFTIGFGWSLNKVNACTTVTDSFNGGTPVTVGTVCDPANPNPTIFTYTQLVPFPQYGCQLFDNTASLSTGGSASASVTACGHDFGLTMGFWQNKNGQGIITGSGSKLGTCALTTWLRAYNPFQDLNASATCSQVATYVTNVIKAANASGATMNAMLKAQMLATALDVFFSTPSLGGNKINAPGAEAVGGLGNVDIDTSNIGGVENDSSAFGGDVCQTVDSLLSYAASQSNAGGTVWYGNVKATQQEAKDVFDAINNDVAFSCQ